ncbi:hypothetical protein K493DRAFT_325204 [Basidiobolus meristosporus CBS 931.73]|uniref:3,4-dihydroxy-2-butanone 4-phosphate synthase n=1 Tax=Basidiobolus meristosporus CBS 931.73 TaxID=1314790 RepID=A0A1Y1Y4G7_9FUNG|nr:hypothetical protein K493DRAFT_325204 [Basidiobolus meristosporus CBS 931.73]|eukprot:ORX92883.1 hypothetical protein K493DRAFT_325204 [Basidiobolus meristosporus CBS 931.73]
MTTPSPRQVICEFDDIPSALKDFASGRFLIVVDNEVRENEGDLILATEKATTESLAFMIRHTSGYVCVPLTNERADQPQLPLTVRISSDPQKTAYTISVDYRHNTTTGISAHDRALTARSLADFSLVEPSEFNRPGHILPLCARDGGILTRIGHTEAGVDRCRLAGLSPVSVVCELINDDGTMARRDDCKAFALSHDIKMITITDLLRYRTHNGLWFSRGFDPLPCSPFTVEINGLLAQSHTVYPGTTSKVK